jgi:general secretion pathway protein F
VIGAIRFARGSSVACGALAGLLESGVPLAAALRTAARASGDHCLEVRLLEVREHVTRGATFSAALQANNGLSPAAQRLARLGEETGQLATMLAHAARLESEQAASRVKHATRLVEPGLVILFGGLVMVVAAALLQAMYGLRVGR